jgi:hypothetical protein
MARWMVVLLLALLSAACGSSDDSSSPGLGPVEFRPAAQGSPTGPTVKLRQKELTDSRLVLELVGERIENLYGLGFRVQLDSQVLQFDEMQAGGAWSQFPDTLARAKLGTPATLVGVVTRRGKQSGFAADGAVLATLTFTRKVHATTELRFVEAPSALVSDDARQIAGVSWYGGALAPRR